jgi:hypothetical protein
MGGWSEDVLSDFQVMQLENGRSHIQWPRALTEAVVFRDDSGRTMFNPARDSRLRESSSSELISQFRCRRSEEGEISVG